ncbi:BtaA family protein [Agrococcus sp. HG114]|uniref:BtaA family protein n=1 Tax=Agrococcus sp. HG114 TaxID=2969757 RepID=UPI00215A546B|nr:BtaA family protein [Agrococcus sp. HG114]MCR8670142.1 BtaA family protein [Agrococcus sp. HG114]
MLSSRGRERGRASAHPRQRLLHGWDWADVRIELEELRPGTRVLASAGAGEVVAALAAAGHTVSAIASNRTQLDYARRRVAGGPFEPGAAERLFDLGRGMIRAASPAWSRRRVRQFLHEDDPLRAAEHWKARLDNRTLASILKTMLGPAGTLTALVLRDFATPLPPHFDEAIRGRIGRALRKHAPSDNPFAWRLLLGEEWPGHRLPAVAPDAIRWIDEPLLDHLERAERGAYDAITISNVIDGADERWVRDLRKAAMRALVPGGPLIARSLATTMDDEAAKRARRDRAMLWGSIVVHRAVEP